METLYLRNLKEPCIVHKESNSFGDQILTFKILRKNGKVDVAAIETFPEGNWEKFTEENMIKVFEKYLP